MCLVVCVCVGGEVGGVGFPVDSCLLLDMLCGIGNFPENKGIKVTQEVLPQIGLGEKECASTAAHLWRPNSFVTRLC